MNTFRWQSSTTAIEVSQYIQYGKERKDVTKQTPPRTRKVRMKNGKAIEQGPRK